MGPISVRDLRKRLSEVIDAAQRGETVAITRRGETVACLGPVPVSGQSQELPDLTEFRGSLSIQGSPMSTLVVQLRQAERL